MERKCSQCMSYKNLQSCTICRDFNEWKPSHESLQQQVKELVGLLARIERETHADRSYEGFCNLVDNIKFTLAKYQGDK